MEDYLNKMKSIANNLTLARSLIPSFDLITQVLVGFDVDYNPIVVQLSEKEDLTCVCLQALLLTFKSRLKQLNALNNLTLNPLANKTKIETKSS